MDYEIEDKIEKWFENGGWKELFKTKPEEFEIYEDEEGDAFIRGHWEKGTTDFAGILCPVAFVTDRNL